MVILPQVGPEMAAFLEHPHVAWARKLTFSRPDLLQVGQAVGPRL